MDALRRASAQSGAHNYEERERKTRRADAAGERGRRTASTERRRHARAEPPSPSGAQTSRASRPLPPHAAPRRRAVVGLFTQAPQADEIENVLDGRTRKATGAVRSRMAVHLSRPANAAERLHRFNQISATVPAARATRKSKRQKPRNAQRRSPSPTSGWLPAIESPHAPAPFRGFGTPQVLEATRELVRRKEQEIRGQLRNLRIQNNREIARLEDGVSRARQTARR